MNPRPAVTGRKSAQWERVGAHARSFFSPLRPYYFSTAILVRSLAAWSVLVMPGVSAIAPPPQVRLLRVPDGGLQPQALVDGSGVLHLVYLKGDPRACDVMYARRVVGQTNFSSPLRVNSIPGSAIAIGTVRGAQFALGRNGRIHVVWNGSDKASSSANAGTPMLYTRMKDGANGFEPERNLMTSTTHLDGGGSVAADPNGHVYVVWHGHRKDGPQEELDRGVFVASSDDDGSTFTPERQVNPRATGVCGCCGLKAFADDQGWLTILYRSANATGNRDSVLLWSTNQAVSFNDKVLGQWHVSTCPMSTHDLGLADGAVKAMWEKAGQIYFADISPQRLAEVVPIVAEGNPGNRKHPTFACGKGRNASTLVAWTEGTGWEKGGALVWEILDRQSASLASGRVDGVPAWDFATAAAEPDGSFTLLY